MNNVGNLLITMWEEQAQMLQDHANRLRKVLKANGEEVPGAVSVKNTKAKADPADKPIKKARGEKKVTKKRALSAYQVFMKEHLKSYKQRHPEMQQTEVLKVIATRWGKLENDKKEKYAEQAKTLKEEGIVASQAAEAEAAGAAGGGDSHHDYHLVPVTDDKNKKRKHDEKENEGGASSSSNHSAGILSSQLSHPDHVEDEEGGGKKKKKKKDKS